MNIFVLDTVPAEAARFHNDRHVASCMAFLSDFLTRAHLALDGRPTALGRGIPCVDLAHGRLAHGHERLSAWVRANSDNYRWSHDLLECLANEWLLRFRTVHRFEESGIVHTLKKPPLNITVGQRTDFYQLMPKEYYRWDAVEAYRTYYFQTLKHLAKWSPPRSVPEWWLKMEQEIKEVAP